MRKSLWIALGAVILLYLAQVPPESTPSEPELSGTTEPTSVAGTPSPTTTGLVVEEARREPLRLTVLNRSGIPTTLTIDENTEVLVVATWCPYTRRLNNALKDVRSRKYLAGRRLVYLLGYDELDKRAAWWVRNGRISQADADALVGSQPHGARLVNPEFLTEAATRRIYFFDSDHPVRYEGYPAAFSGPPNEFLTSYGNWLTRRLGMPREVRDALWTTYPVEGG